MRLSVAGAAMDAQVQNDILLIGFTRNRVVVGRQPHPGPNFVLRRRPHRFAVAPPRAALGPSWVPLLGLLNAAASLIFSCLVVAFFSSLCSSRFCLLLLSFFPLPPRVVLVPLLLFIVHFFTARGTAATPYLLPLACRPVVWLLQ
jgi:hypothetical protein